jgi:hypothetical protein
LLFLAANKQQSKQAYNQQGSFHLGRFIER